MAVPAAGKVAAEARAARAATVDWVAERVAKVVTAVVEVRAEDMARVVEAVLAARAAVKAARVIRPVQTWAHQLPPPAYPAPNGCLHKQPHSHRRAIAMSEGPTTRP
jgi:hypothetical protein